MRAAAPWVPVIVVLLSGCVPVPLPQPRTIESEDAFSALRPVERLGRWDGERFVDVADRTIPPSHLYVLVHGWAPGWGRHVIANPTLRAWEARDEAEGPFEPWMPALARAIQSADPYAVVVVYSWLDDAATGRFILAQRNAFAHTAVHGRWLAHALEAARQSDFFSRGGQVRLIGHSYGARVATLGALEMHRAPDQLTIFDSPDAPLTHITGSQTGLETMLRELPIGWGRGQVFVDNYVSMVGRRYNGPGLEAVVDVSLAPPYSALDYRKRHLYPMDFYASTAGRDFGFGWSPMISRQSPAPGCYEQVYGQVDVEHGCAGLP